MTRDLIADMLGVRRARVTLAAGRLQRSGLIRYARGRITILDRTGLKARVCEWHRVGNKDSERLLGLEAV